MHFLSWAVIGIIIGSLTGKLVKEGGYGPTVNMAMGIGGALAGGSIMHLASSPAYGGTVYTTAAAILGAVLGTGINAHFTARNRYA